MKRILFLLLYLGNQFTNAQMVNGSEFISEFNEYLNSKQSNIIEGYYNIDTSQKNMHLFKKFIIALKKTENTFTLFFIDSECFGNKKYWKLGDIYAFSELLEVKNDTIDIFLNEVGESGIKVLSKYELKIGEKKFQLVTKGDNMGIDNFIKITPNQIADDFSLSEIEIRVPNDEENKSLRFEYQSGIELMFWLSELETTELDTDLILKSLNVAFDSLNKIENYPIEEYNSVWHATFGLSVVFANTLISEFDWEWIFVENARQIDIGWILVSKDKKFGIRIDQIFYEKIMNKQNVDFIDFFKKIELLATKRPIDDGQILFIELPCE